MKKLNDKTLEEVSGGAKGSRPHLYKKGKTYTSKSGTVYEVIYVIETKQGIMYRLRIEGMSATPEVEESHFTYLLGK